MYLSFATLTNVGRKRDHNEDFITHFTPPDENDLKLSGSLFIVADGVGGASQGEKASKYAAENVLYEYFNRPEESPQDRLRYLIQDAGNQINSYAEEGERFMRMATTMVAAVILDKKLIVANVGDSRAYLIRDNVANQITKDHSFVAEMVRDGFMTEEEARVSKKKNRITRSLGGERDVRVDIFDDIILAEGDKVLLCSDGFSQYATKETIVALAQNGTPDEIATRMVAHANTQGGSDNISVTLIKVSESPLDETLSMSSSGENTPVSPIWDAGDTDHGAEKEPKLLALLNNLDKKGKIILAVSFFVLLSSFILLFALFPNKDNEEDIPAHPSVTSFPPETLNPTIETTIPAMSPAPYAETPFNTSVTPTTETASSEISGQWCQFTIRDHDIDDFKGLPELLDGRFHITHVSSTHFVDNTAPHIKCADIDNNPCNNYPQVDKNENPNYYGFNSGWIMEFSMDALNISPENCKLGGGSSPLQ